MEMPILRCSRCGKVIDGEPYEIFTESSGNGETGLLFCSRECFDKFPMFQIVSEDNYE